MPWIGLKKLNSKLFYSKNKSKGTEGLNGFTIKNLANTWQIQSLCGRAGYRPELCCPCPLVHHHAPQQRERPEGLHLYKFIISNLPKNIYDTDF